MMIEDSEKLVLTIDDLVKLGIGSRNTLYYLARQNKLPWPVISVGKRLYVSAYAVKHLRKSFSWPTVKNGLVIPLIGLS